MGIHSRNHHSALLPVGSVTGGIGQSTGDAPLTSGGVVLQGQTLHVTLKGSTAVHAFNAWFCTGASNCTAEGSITTDAQGNVSADLSTTPMFGIGVFLFTDGSGAEFISAFRVQ